MNYKTPYDALKTICDYVIKGYEPGHFVGACLANNLMHALGAADIRNRESIFDIAAFIYNNTPSECHGSEQLVDRWLENIGSESHQDAVDYYIERYNNLLLPHDKYTL